MPSIEQDLYAFVSTDADVLTALGGKNTLWKSAIPKGKETQLPAIVMQTVYTSNPYTADGALNSRTKRIQFDSYSSDPTTTAEVSDTIKNLLQNLSGSLGNTVVQASFVTTEMDMPDEPGAGGYVFRRLLRIEFHYYDLASPQPVSPTLPAPPTGANAAFIQGIPIDSIDTPQDGQALVYDAASGEWKPSAVSGSGGSGDGSITSIDCGTF
jgi:hypothetical protein